MVKLEELKSIYNEDGTLKDIEIGAEAYWVVELLNKVKEMTPKEVKDKYEDIVVAIDYCQASREDSMANLLGLPEIGREVEEYLDFLVESIDIEFRGFLHKKPSEKDIQDKMDELGIEGCVYPNHPFGYRYNINILWKKEVE